MPNSQNGWPVHKTSDGLVPLRWITGRVLPGDVFTVLDYFGEEFNRLVEPIDKASSWGHKYRTIVGSEAISNHSSATAIDLNAPKHPIGKSNTFNSAQRNTIRGILAVLEGVVRWGGDYSGRKDDMHFEIVGSAAAVKRVADKIRNLKNPSVIPAPGTSTQGKAVDDVAVIYMAGKTPGFGILASNGGWAGLASAEEKKNLMAAGVKEVWIEERTLSYLIKDSRGLITRDPRHFIQE